MADLDNRRPLASRQTGWAAALTRWLAGTSITPNQISIASMVFAAIAGAAFWAAGTAQDPMPRALFLVAAAAFCQARLLCNLFDGMVAIEAGKSAADGGFWNEFPDRVSDLLIFAGIGYGIGQPALGWAAVAMAILTAYVRELGRGCGAIRSISPDRWPSSTAWQWRRSPPSPRSSNRSGAAATNSCSPRSGWWLSARLSRLSGDPSVS